MQLQMKKWVRLIGEIGEKFAFKTFSAQDERVKTKAMNLVRRCSPERSSLTLEDYLINFFWQDAPLRMMEKGSGECWLPVCGIEMAS